MDEATKKKLPQILLLAVLLIIMGVMMISMLRKSSAPEPAPASSQPSTAMQSAGITDSDRDRIGGGQGGSSQASNALKLNPNMWRVYAINPPRNPFTRQESWYADTFRQLLPGYPQLEDSGFFEKTTEVLPDLNRLFGEDIDFEFADLTQRYAERNYTVDGVSADGKLATRITATEARPNDVNLTFDGDGNIINNQATDRPSRAGAIDGGIEVNNIPFEGTGLPGLESPGGQRGGSMKVHGVSIHSGKSSALILFNGSTRIVRVGDDLSAQYAVSRITSGGIEVKDTETGETKFLELQAPGGDADKNPPASMMRGMNL